MNIRELNRLIFAPDGDSAGGASPIALTVPEVAPAVSEKTVSDVDLGGSKAAEQVYGVQSPEEAGFGDPVMEMEEMEARAEKRPVRERDPVTGKFLPKGEKAPERVVAKAPAKPAKPQPKPAAKVEPPKPEVPQKIKLGDEEKTLDEIQAELKELRELKKTQSEAATPPEEKKEKIPVERKPEEIAAERQQRRDAFISERAKTYFMDPKELDNILAGGEKAVQAFGTALAKVEIETREAMTAEFNRVIGQLWERQNPLVERDQQLAEYQRDHSFLESNQDIKSHPKGYETYRDIRTKLEQGFERIRQAVANNTANAHERVWLANREIQTEESLLSSLATLTREELAKLSPVKSPNAAAPVVEKPTQKSPSTVKPFNGDRPGGAAAPVARETDQARQLREMEQAGY